MDDQSRKTMRNFYCRDYLWELYEAMAGDFDCSIDFLINEAMRHYARSKNYSPPANQPEPNMENGGRAGMNGPSGAAPNARGTPMNGGPPRPNPPMGTNPGSYGNAGANNGRAVAPSMRAPAVNAPPGGRPMPMPSGGVSAPRPPTMLADEQPQANDPRMRGAPVGPPGGMRGAPTPISNVSRPGAGPNPRPPVPTVNSQPESYDYKPASAAPAPRSAPTAPPAPRPVAAASSPAKLGLSLIFQGQRFPVDKEEFVIGRGSKTSDLAIKDGNVSRKHASVIFRNGSFFIKDCGSTNGIDYNGMRIDNKKIEEGDVFYICDYELRFTYR
jgi:neural Wiskott-Aldrich syndrome protein